MPLSLYQRLTSLDLTPTTISIQLSDCSIRQPVGILEDVPVRVGEFVIPYDFFVVDMDESPICLLFWGDHSLLQLERKLTCRLARYRFVYVKRGWISVSLLPYLPQHLPPLHPLHRLYLHSLQRQYLRLLLMFLLVLRSSMEIEDPIFGNSGMMV